MTHTVRNLVALLCLAAAGSGYSAVSGANNSAASGANNSTVSGAPTSSATKDNPALPAWEVLEFEERAFWATAKSRLELQPTPGDETLWQFSISSSVVGNSEEMTLDFDPASGRISKRERLSRGKKGKEQRLKSFDYQADAIVRERRSPGSDVAAPPTEWPLSSRVMINYPQAAGELVVTSPHLLILLAQRLQTQGPGVSQEVLVHTDRNFYRVRMTSGNGIPINAKYGISGDSRFSGRRDTMAVALQVQPEGQLVEKDDFSVLGLSGDIILFFDKDSGLPLQVRGTAPRIGDTDINLKSVTMRQAQR